MKKTQKLSINDIKVSSFVTSINKQDSVTVIGGLKTNEIQCKRTDCQDCGYPSAPTYDLRCFV